MRLLLFLALLTSAGCLVEVPLDGRSCDAEHACREADRCVEGECVPASSLESCTVTADCGAGET